jgi:hypothetical protein
MKLWNKAINGFPPETRNGACKSQRPPRGPLFDARVRTIDVMLKLVKLLVN